MTDDELMADCLAELGMTEAEFRQHMEDGTEPNTLAGNLLAALIGVQTLVAMEQEASMANDWYAEHPPSDDGKCRHCAGQLRTASMDAIRCDGCGLFYMLVEAQPYAHRNGETAKPTVDGHYWLSLRPNYTLVANVYAGQCAGTDGAWGALDSVPDTARWWGPLQPPRQK